jgi:hypothetical protein
VYRRHHIVAYSAFTEAQARFVNHDFQWFRAAGYPPAECYVHGVCAESVRYPLEQDAARFPVAVQFMADFGKTGFREAFKLLAPDANGLSGGFERGCQLRGVVTDSARLGRKFAGDNVPGTQ